jgi:transcriptional regulator EpsA
MSAAPDHHDDDTSTLLDSGQVRALLRTLEGATALRHSAQFFVWSQGDLQRLLPHQLLLCGAYRRSCRELRFELFNSVPLAPALAEALCAPGAALPQRLQAAWVARGQGRPLVLPAEEGMSGFAQLLVQGVSRPQRPSEIESFFVLAHREPVYGPRQALLLELLMPHLHSGWRRVLEAAVPARAAAPSQAPAASGLTAREREILRGLREGLSNQQIGSELAISALTVKNHVQRILRKLGASNRAHAVARALSLQLPDLG